MSYSDDEDDDGPEALNVEDARVAVERKVQEGQETEARVREQKAQRAQRFEEIEARRAADREVHAAAKQKKNAAAAMQEHQQQHELPARLLQVLETLSSPEPAELVGSQKKGSSQKLKRERQVVTPKLKKKLADIWEQGMCVFFFWPSPF